MSQIPSRFLLTLLLAFGSLFGLETMATAGRGAVRPLMLEVPIRACQQYSARALYNATGVDVQGAVSLPAGVFDDTRWRWVDWDDNKKAYLPADTVSSGAWEEFATRAVWRWANPIGSEGSGFSTRFLVNWEVSGGIGNFGAGEKSQVAFMIQPTLTANPSGFSFIAFTTMWEPAVGVTDTYGGATLVDLEDYHYFGFAVRDTITDSAGANTATSFATWSISLSMTQISTKQRPCGKRGH